MQFETIHLIFIKLFVFEEFQRHSIDSSQASTKESRTRRRDHEGCILNNKLKFQYFIEFLIIWISDKNKARTQVYYK